MKKYRPEFDQLVRFNFVRYTRGKVLDLGFGPNRAFDYFVGLRLRGSGDDTVPNVPVDDFSTLSEVIDGSCDALVAADVLPKIEDGPAALENWLRCIRIDGHVCIYEPKGSTSALLALAEAVGDGVDVVRLQKWGEGAFIVLQKKESGFYFSYAKPKHTKTCCIVRHGGFGDQLQAAQLLPELKRQGFHITFLTTPKSKPIIEHDPHVDEWFLIDDSQVPNSELVPFWGVIEKDYDRFVQLNESCEGTFLAMPARAQNAWPHAVRHYMMNRNYAEFAAMLAQIPFVPEGRFYGTPEETKWAEDMIQLSAKALKDPDGPAFTILWVLAGSSPHKFTPHQDMVIRMILGSLKRAVVIMVGNEACKILEAGWEEERRVIRTSGQISIRHSLELARHVDLVIGPETGVLNSVAYMEIPKVVMLSHSSHENLTKHWVNAHVIPGIAECYPCHRLHYTTEFCDVDEETGAAMCQKNVDPRVLYAPIEQEYLSWARVKMIRAA